MSKDISDICVIQTAFLGDLTITAGLLALIRERMPHTKITLILRQGLEKVMENQGLADQIFSFKKGQGTGFLAELVKKSGAHTVLLAQRSFRSGLACKIAGIKNIIGFDNSGARLFQTRTIPFDRDKSEAQRLLDLARPLFAGDFEDFHGNKYGKLRLLEQHKERALPLLKGIKPHEYIVLAPGSVWDTKRWPCSYFGLLAGLLNKKTGLPTVLTGGENELEISAKVMAYSSPRPLNLTGFTDLSSLMGIIGMSAGFISNDSGSAHIAAAFDIPQVTIFGPTVQEFGFKPASIYAKAISSPVLCRPCGLHGAPVCPLKSRGKMAFDPLTGQALKKGKIIEPERLYGLRSCMKTIGVNRVCDELLMMMKKKRASLGKK